MLVHFRLGKEAQVYQTKPGELQNAEMRNVCAGTIRLLLITVGNTASKRGADDLVRLEKHSRKVSLCAIARVDHPLSVR